MQPSYDVSTVDSQRVICLHSLINAALVLSALCLKHHEHVTGEIYL